MTAKEVRDEFDDACDTTELQEQYSVVGFLAPYVNVTRKSDGQKGTMMFQHEPRMYFKFEGY